MGGTMTVARSCSGLSYCGLWFTRLERCWRTLRLTLIDWQCPRLGDPAEDLALFLSPAMQLLYRGAPLGLAEQDAFLAAYPDPQVTARLRALLPWFHWRMAAYCLWKAERGGAEDREAMALEIAALQSISPSMA